jgi:hypothetical protein
MHAMYVCMYVCMYVWRVHGFFDSVEINVNGVRKTIVRNMCVGGCGYVCVCVCMFYTYSHSHTHTLSK